MEESSPTKDVDQAERKESIMSQEAASKKWSLEKSVGFVKENVLLLSLIASMFVGVLLGACLRLADPPLTFRQQMYLAFPGEIFMNLLQLVILPLIVTSLIAGVTSLDAKASGKIGARAIAYYFTTMFMAVVLGILLVLIIKPGEKGTKPDIKTVNVARKEAADTFMDLIRQMFPNNLVEASFRKRLTTLVEVDMTEEERNISGTEYRPVLKYAHGTNMLGILVFSIAIAIAMNSLGYRARQLKDLISVMSDATLVLVTFVLWYAPIGITFLVAAQIVKMVDPITTFVQLGYYFLTVMLGLAIHGAVVLPALYFLMVRKSPLRFIGGILQALITALGTGSSSATIPVTLKNLEQNNHIDPRITSFVIPVGATINMDGTALYEAVAVIFIGQVNGLDLGIGNVITICIMATAAAVGAAGIPSAGLVTMVLVLTSVGFPTEGIGMIWAIDWLLDRFRTLVNVLGDAIGAGIVAHFSQDDLGRTSLESQEMVPAGTDTEDDAQDLTQVVDNSGPPMKIPHLSDQGS